MSRTVLVTGATGLVGTAVVRRLKDSDWTVRGMTHTPSKTESLRASGCSEVVIGDVTDPAGMIKAAEGADAIIHSVGVLIEKGKATYESVNIGGTRNAVEAAKLAGCDRFVMMSALGLQPVERNAYAASKVSCEDLVKSSALSYAILRSSYVCGPGAEILQLFKSLASMPVVPVIGKGAQLMQFVSVADVASCLVGSLDLEASTSEVFELCGPVPVTYDEVIDLVASLHGKTPKRKLHMPVRLINLTLPLAEIIPGSVVSRTTVEMLLRDSTCDPRGAAKAFGVELTPVEDCLREAYGIK